MSFFVSNFLLQYNLTLMVHCLYNLRQTRLRRSIQPFDGISEVNFIFLRRRRRFGKKVFLFASARYICTFEAFSEHEMHILGVSALF